MRQKIAGIVCAAALLCLSGCLAPKRTVNADALTPTLGPVLERHDAYVSADESLDDLEKETYLRSSALLKGTMITATENPNWPDAPSDPE